MSENFLNTLHAKFLQLRGAAHFPDVLHDLISAVVNKVHDFEARLHALEHSAPQATPNAGSAAPSSGTAGVLNVTSATDPAPHTETAMPIVPPADSPAAHMNPTMLAGLQAGHENDPAPQPMPSAPSEPAEDLWSRTFAFHIGDYRFWKGRAGDVTVTTIPVPAGWRGAITVQAGESSAAPPKVDQFDVWVTNAQGETIATLAEKNSYCSQAFAVTSDGALDVHLRQYQDGGGIVEIQPQKA